MWIDGVWSRFQLGNLRGWATPRFGLRRYWNEWELAGTVRIYPDTQEPTCQLRQTREARHGPWISKYPPTPFAAGGARERRNYQQQVSVQKAMLRSTGRCPEAWAGARRLVPSMLFDYGKGALFSSLSPARGSFDRSCAGRKPAARGRKQVGSWQCGKASKLKVWR